MRRLKRAYCAFSIVVLLALAGLCAGTLLYGMIYAWLSMDWQATKARVVHIELLPRSAVMRYEYTIDNTTYAGDKLAFLSEGTIPDKEFIERQFHVGQAITVFVNADKPWQSVVFQRRLRLAHVWIPLLIVVFCAWAGIWQARRCRALARESD